MFIFSSSFIVKFLFVSFLSIKYVSLSAFSINKERFFEHLFREPNWAFETSFEKCLPQHALETILRHLIEMTVDKKILLYVLRLNNLFVTMN